MKRIVLFYALFLAVLAGIGTLPFAGHGGPGLVADADGVALAPLDALRGYVQDDGYLTLGEAETTLELSIRNRFGLRPDTPGRPLTFLGGDTGSGGSGAFFSPDWRPDGAGGSLNDWAGVTVGDLSALGAGGPSANDLVRRFESGFFG